MFQCTEDIFYCVMIQKAGDPNCIRFYQNLFLHNTSLWFSSDSVHHKRELWGSIFSSTLIWFGALIHQQDNQCMHSMCLCSRLHVCEREEDEEKLTVKLLLTFLVLDSATLASVRSTSSKMMDCRETHQGSGQSHNADSPQLVTVRTNPPITACVLTRPGWCQRRSP